MRLARGSAPWVGVPMAAAVLLGAAGSYFWFRILFILGLFMIYFHRDPERSPKGEGMISPADGKIVEALSDKVSIYMSPFDVHVNRSPLDGVIGRLDYRHGSHRPAFLSGGINEQNMIEIECLSGQFKVYQIAGSMARKIVCYVRPGDAIVRGERLGMIRFGSRVEVTIPPGYSISVESGERVRAGETVIAVKG